MTPLSADFQPHPFEKTPMDQLLKFPAYNDNIATNSNKMNLFN